MKSFRLKDGSGAPRDGGRKCEQNFRGEKRSNETHESTTDPDARLYRKSDGRESWLCYMAHAIMENRNGLTSAVNLITPRGLPNVRLSWHGSTSVVRANASRWAPTKLMTSSTSCKLSNSATSCCMSPSTAQSVGTASTQNSCRPAHCAPSRLSDQPVHPQADRGDIWLRKSIGGLDQLKVRHRESKDRLHPCARRL